MKKILSILLALGLTATTGTTVIACGQELNKLKIEVDQETISLFLDETKEIKITNFEKLNNVNAISSDTSIVQINIAGETIEITGIKEGTTTIIISADNSENKSIEVTIQPSLKIELDKNKSEIFLDDLGDTISIKNFELLENVEIQILGDETVIDAKLNESKGTINYTALKEGKTRIEVSANHAIKQRIDVTILPLSSIKLSKYYFSEYLDEGKLYSEIINFDDLENLEVEKISNPEVLKAKINEETKTVEITLLQPGHATIYFHSKHTEKCSINVDVLELETFEVDKEKLDIDVNKTTQVEIIEMGAVKLEDIIVKSEIENRATAKFDWKTNTIKITGISAGPVNITINAKHATEKIIEVNVNSLEDLIILDEDNASIYQEETKVIKITNISDLEDVDVKSKNDNLATAELNSTTGEITIVGIYYGTTWITVNAKHAIEKLIEVNISNLKNIVTDRSESVLVSGDEEKIFILNWPTIENEEVKPYIDDKDLISVDIVVNEEEKIGIIVIQAYKKIGETKIHIKGNHTTEKIIDVEVIKKEISVNKTSSWLYKGATKTIEIEEFESLDNVKVNSDDGVSFTYELDQKTGIITVTGEENILHAEADIVISADNAFEKKIKIYIYNQENWAMMDPSKAQEMINELVADDLLEFAVKRGTKKSELEKILDTRIREIFKENHLSTALIRDIKIIFSSLPTQDELNEGGIWNSEDDSTIKISFSVGPATVKCNYYIFIQNN